MVTIVKGSPIDACGMRIVPLAKREQREYALGSTHFWQLSAEPLGVQVFGDGEPYALDLDGNRSEDLLSV